jgi:hypothetical protein
MKRIIITEKQAKKIHGLLNRKKVNITKEQFNRLFENHSVEDMTSFTKMFVSDLYNNPEAIKTYEFWGKNGISYEQAMTDMLDKGLILKDKNSYVLTRKFKGMLFPKPEDALEAVAEHLGSYKTKPKSITKNELDESGNEPWNIDEPELRRPTTKSNQFKTIAFNNEIAILKTPSGDKFVFYFLDLINDLKSQVKTTIGKDLDGELDYGTPENTKIDAQMIDYYVNENLPSLSGGVGLNDFEQNKDLVKIDPELNQYLRNMYSESKSITNVLNPMMENITTANSKESIKNQIETKPTNKFTKAELQSNINAKRQQELDRRKTETDVKETTVAGASSSGGSSGPFSPPMGLNKKPLEIVEQGIATSGQYDANALPGISRDGSFKKQPKIKAFNSTQYPKGEFIEMDDCTSLNNNKSAQNGGCSTGAIDNVVKTKQSKNSIISKNSIYETLVKRTGKSIEEIKKIVG